MSVTIPNGVTSIGDDAFYNCYGLTSVTIPTSVTSIGLEAFRACSGLTSLTIPNGVKFIEVSAFEGCSGLTSVTIPSTVTSIGADAFRGVFRPDEPDHSQQRHLHRGLGVPRLFQPGERDQFHQRHLHRDATFYGCSSLASVSIPSSVTSIGEDAFDGCSGLASVTIPISVTSIGAEAFRGCSSLTSVTIPYGVTSIGSETFENCYSLTSVNIPTSVNSIGEDAFYGCSGLTSLTIPSSVTSIGQEAFRACSSLTSVTIPNSVTSIGNYAFYMHCSALTSAYFQGNAPASFGTGVFDNDAAGFTIYYPANAMGFTTPTWKGYHAVPNSSAQGPALLLVIERPKGVYLTSTNLTVGLQLPSSRFAGFNQLGKSRLRVHRDQFKLAIHETIGMPAISISFSSDLQVVQ
jgi:hypothetical protein